MCVISATRQRLADEIIPVSAEHSRTVEDKEEEYDAARAIDLDLNTFSLTQLGSVGKTWLKVKLAKLSCIRQVSCHSSDSDTPYLTWTCTSSDCSTCEGNSYGCSSFLLTASIEGGSSEDLPLIADCKHGDTVTLEKTGGDYFTVREIAITGKQGEIIDSGR